MQIFVTGDAHHEIMPDQITASVTFNTHAATYDEALEHGVRRVKEYLEFIEQNTDFQVSDFKTHAYNIREEFHTNRIDPKTAEDLDKNLTKRVSDGFFFTQYAYVKFDYNKERLSKLLVLTSKTEGAPRFHISFGLKDEKAYERGLIGDAYRDAQKKAETLAAAADKHLRDCVRVDIDHGSNDGMAGTRMYKSAAYFDAADTSAVKDEIRNINEAFHPDNIPVNKTISCVWETSD